MKKTAIALSLFTASFALASFASADTSPNAPHLATSGQGRVQAQPDMATLVIEVNATQTQASQAKKQVDTRVARYFDFLHQQGIADKDINAANVITQAQYDYSQQGKAKLVGYQASRQVTVRVHQLDKLNPLLDGALAAGLNEIRSVSMAVEHPEKYQQQARQAAVADAISKAKSLASGFNATLGAVWSINYQTSSHQVMPMVRMMSAKVANAETSVDQTYQQQKLDFSDNVDVVFTLNAQSLGATPGDHTPPTNP